MGGGTSATVDALVGEAGPDLCLSGGGCSVTQENFEPPCGERVRLRPDFAVPGVPATPSACGFFAPAAIFA